MSIRFATKAALALALTAVTGVNAAHADSSYQPYYMQDRDAHQFATIMPMTTEQPAPVQAPGQPANWQAPQVTTLPSPPSVDSPLDNHFYHVNNEVWGAAGSSFLNYKETVAPIPDSDRGWLANVAAGVDFMSHSNLFLAVEGSGSFNKAHYDGAYLLSPTTPTQSSVNETIGSGDIKVGQGILVDDNVMLTPYVEFGGRYWSRDLGNGELETYHNYDILAGTMLQVAPTAHSIVMVYASVGPTFMGKMENNAFANSYSLGGSAMEKIGGKVGVDLTRQVELFATLDYDHFHYGSSQAVYTPALSGYTGEPGSRTSETTARVGVGYHFK